MPIHCPECRFEFPERLEQVPAECPRCGAPLYFSQAPAEASRRRANYGFLRHSPTAVIIGANLVLYLLTVLASRSLDPNIDVLTRFGANVGGLVVDGQWWRLITSVFLHGGLLHIAFNMWALFNLGLLGEILYGRRNFTILYFLCGLGGAVASVWWHPTIVGVGASGAIFGIAGALLPALKFQKNPRIAAALRGNLGSITMFVVYNLAFGAASPHIDNAAHLGGLVTGIVVGFLLPSYTVDEERHQTGRAAVVFASMLAIIVWVGLYARGKNQDLLAVTRAKELVQAGKPKDAIASLNKSLQQNPKLQETRLTLAALLDAQKQYSEALPVWQRLARDNPKDPRLQAILCDSYLKNNQPQAAMVACANAAQLQPENAEYHFNVGKIALLTNKSAEAVVAFRKAYALHPNGYQENLFLGLALLQDGQKLEAQQRLKRAVELNPKDPMAQRALAEASR